MNNLESIWNSLLSRDPDEIRKVFAELDPASRKVVLDHLNAMVSEDGWHPEQVSTARIALKALKPGSGLMADN